MSQKRIIIIMVTLVLCVIVYLGSEQIITTLETNPKVSTNPVLAGLTSRRTGEIERANEIRNILLVGLAGVGILLFAISGDRNNNKEKAMESNNQVISDKQSNTNNKTTGTKATNGTIANAESIQKNGENLIDDKIVLSLLNLKENGILTEEEFNEKIKSINN